MTVFAEITECHGRKPFIVRVVDVDEQRAPLVEVDTEVDSIDPLAIALLVLRIDGLVFPEPGEYRVQLVSAGTPLMERRLVLTQIEEPNG